MKQLREQLPQSVVALLQALALILYVGLVALLMSKADSWFAHTPSFLNIAFFLIIFTTSALMSAVLTLGYPAYLLWRGGDISQSLRLVLYTVLWLLSFITAFLVFWFVT